MIRYLIALLALLLISCSVYATCVTRQRIVVVTPQARATVVVRKELAFVPFYTAAYVGESGDLKAILETLKAIDARLKVLEGGKAAVSPPQNDPFNPKKAKEVVSPFLTIVQTKCASCHEEKVSARGGNLVLLKGSQLVTLTDKQALKVVTKTYKGDMPPKASKLTLTDEEIGQIVDHMDSRP